MMSKKDAEKAIEGANGSTVGGEKDGDPNAKGKERVIAVDWALSKERWEVEKEKLEEENDDEEGSEGSEAGSNSEGLDDESEDDNIGVHEDSDETDDEDGEDGEGSDMDDDDDPPDRPQLPPPETGNTLFIRNVPFTATEEELRTLYVCFMVNFY
jgi:nucleolar protein 4